MQKVLVLMFVISLCACTNTKETTDTMKEQYPGSEIVEAQLIRLKAFNKAGREMPYAGDFYLVLDGEQVFVKMMDSKVTSDQLEPLLDKTSTFRIVRGEGLWDTDDPGVQSRIGRYVAIIEIVN